MLHTLHDAPRQTPRARRRDANHARILDAAMELVAEGRLEALSMGRLAEAAAYTPGALYRYFPGKDALLAALVGQVLDELQVFLLSAESALPQPARPLPRVFALARRMLGETAEAEDVTQETMLRLWKIAPDWEADRAALEGMARKLKPGGRILITVPAHPWMWSAHDVVNHHKRRYTRGTLKAVIGEAGLKLEMLSWFNSLLFPLAAGARVAGRLTGKEDSDDKLPPRPVNALFEKIFGLERYALGRLPFPPGVSLAAIVSAPSAT